MEQVANQVIFFLLSAVVVVCSIMAVTSRRILRAATYLLFVLFATAGYYFQLDYHFLGAVQVTIYAGGILVLIGHALMGMDKYQYLLPFEAISVLLLACIIGGIMIARKR